MNDVFEQYRFKLEKRDGIPEGVTWLDIETEKVLADNSWGQKMRWRTFMAGIAWVDAGYLYVGIVSDSESGIISWLRKILKGEEVRYCATREFDEMVLRGRFTNARRAHAEKPGKWPNLNSERSITWTNIRKNALARTWERAEDVESKDVPAVWQDGQRKLVATHCFRDVLENVLRDPQVHLTYKTRQKLIKEVASA